MHTSQEPTNPIIIEGEPVRNTNKFTYLGSVLSVEDGALSDINARLTKARFFHYP